MKIETVTLPSWDSYGHGPAPCLQVPDLGASGCAALLLVLTIIVFRHRSRANPASWRLCSLGFAALVGAMVSEMAMPLAMSREPQIPEAAPWILGGSLVGFLLCLLLSFKTSPRRAP
ncbi:MAG: hypothetical protein RL095_1584 [Verrucomicrobiota bacterium]|jgi:hypothetical protein